MRVFICSLIAASVLLLVPVTAVAAPTALQATGVNVRACFKLETGTPGGLAYAEQPIYLWQWAYSYQTQQYAPVVIREGRTNASGCGTFFSIKPGAWYQAHAYLSVQTQNGCTITSFTVNQKSEWKYVDTEGTSGIPETTAALSRSAYLADNCSNV